MRGVPELTHLQPSYLEFSVLHSSNSALLTNICYYLRWFRKKMPCNLRELLWPFLDICSFHWIDLWLPLWLERTKKPPNLKPNPPLLQSKTAPQYRRRLLLQNQIPLEAFSICVIFLASFLPFMPNPNLVIFFLIYFFNTVLPPLAPNRLLHNLFYSTLQ